MGIRLVANPSSFDYYLGLMKNLLRYLAFVLMVGSTYAQSNLPACPSSGYFHNCFGSFISNGARYVGEFKENNFNGKGTFTSSNGTKYVGEFKDNNFNGQGTITYADGNKYVGEFKDSKQNGQGTFTHPNGERYVGEFKDDKYNGQGTYTYEDGTRYVGDWRDDNRNGQGTYTYANGNKYVGEFKDDKYNGQGTMYASNGSVKSQGIWADGIFVRSVIVQQASSPRVQQSNQTAIPTGKRVALVVGNANYKVRPLKNPRNDADDISRSLRSSGFEVIDLRDASLQQMRNGVRQFGDRLINNDVGLVYFSGHGVEVKGRNFFIPVNADIQREDEIADQGLDVSLILEKMSTAGKGVNILIVDACRDDPFGRSFRSTSRGLAQMDAPRGTIIAYATSPGKVASDGDARERNSPYTKHLLRVMQSPNKPIEQVFKEVRRAVQDETKNQQTPWENTSLSGDFFFKVQR